MVEAPVPKPAPGNHDSIAAQYARAKAIRDAEDSNKVKKIMAERGLGPNGKPKTTMERLNETKASNFKREWGWVVGFFAWLL
jgi:phosphatidylinositol glycan class O